MRKSGGIVMPVELRASDATVGLVGRILWGSLRGPCTVHVTARKALNAELNRCMAF